MPPKAIGARSEAIVSIVRRSTVPSSCAILNRTRCALISPARDGRLFKPPDRTWNMEIVAVAAVAENGVIGAEGGLPWDINEDLVRFRELTLGGAVIMGRRTYDSLPGELKRRLTVVVSRSPGEVETADRDAVVVASPEAALESARSLGLSTAYVAGGESMYAELLPYCDRMELTEVGREPDGDAMFPWPDLDDWSERYRLPSSSHPDVDYVTYIRRNGSRQQVL